MQTHCNESTGIQRPLLPVQGNMGELGSQYIPHSHPGSTQKSNSVCKWPEVPEELQTTATQVAKCWEPCQQRTLCSNTSRQQRTYWAWHETFTEQPKCLQIEAAFWARMAGGKKKPNLWKLQGRFSEHVVSYCVIISTDASLACSDRRVKKSADAFCISSVEKLKEI